MRHVLGRHQLGAATAHQGHRATRRRQIAVRFAEAEVAKQVRVKAPKEAWHRVAVVFDTTLDSLAQRDQLLHVLIQRRPRLAIPMD